MLAMEELRLRSLQSIELDHYFTSENALEVLPRYKTLAVLSEKAVEHFKGLVADTQEIKLITATREQAEQSHPPNISVLIVAVETEEDLEFAVRGANEFLYCAQKYVYGKNIEPDSKLHSQALELSKTISGEYLSSSDFSTGAQLLAQFRLRDGQIIELATNLFHEFDRDQSGQIDLSEIREIGTRLGQGLTDEDLNVIMQDIDVDGDGKISLGEFGAWWRSGRHGRSRKMKEIASKMSSMTGFLEKYGEKLKVVAGQQTLTKTKWNLSVGNVAEIETPGIRVKGQLTLNKPKQEMASQLQQFADFPVMLMATFNLREGVDHGQTVLTLTNLLRIPNHKTLCSIADSKLILAFLLKKNKHESTEQSYERLGQAMSSAPVEQRFDFELLSLKSPQRIAEDLRRSPLEQVLDGLLVKVQCELWSFYHPLLKTLIERMNKAVRPLLNTLLSCSMALHLTMNPLATLPTALLAKVNTWLGEFFEEKVRVSRDGQFKFKQVQALHEAVTTDQVQIFARFFDVILDLTVEANGLGAMLTQKKPSLD